MSVYSSTPGHGPSPTGLITTERISQSGRRHQHLVLTQLHVGEHYWCAAADPPIGAGAPPHAVGRRRAGAVRARRRATPVELQVRCRRLLRDDDGMSSLTVATTPVIANRSDGRWVIREVSNRVEFLLDGRRLSDFLEETELGRLDHQVTPFEFPAPDAQAVLSGRTPFDPSLHDASRVPLLGLSLRRPVVRRPHRATRRGCGRHTLV